MTTRTFTLDTDFRSLTHPKAFRNSQRWNLDHVAIQAFEGQAQAFGTNGCVLAITEDVEISSIANKKAGLEPEGDFENFEVFIPRDKLPRSKKVRFVETWENATLPKLDGILPNGKQIESSVTVRVALLRQLLDALTPVNADPEATVTIGINSRANGAALVATDNAFGAIMPVKDPVVHLANIDARIERAERIDSNCSKS